MLDRSDVSLEAVASALERVVEVAYGRHNTILESADRRHRLCIHKLVNQIRFLNLLSDYDVFELGYRCPEQLRSYHRSLGQAIHRAYVHKLDRETLILAEEAHERIWQIERAVTLFYDGLS